ncbi:MULTISPECIES: hypothetical protein [Nocardioides]|uniref:Uncharacterized protein n=1 Tax=Nocardioides vastitatis TaxID=2568655 RepID=A0ABW0ZMA4_9ACTN|nr:hypothetical protein [Nocardioides sp.]
MTRANYHWSRDAVLHVGVDPEACPDCRAELDLPTSASVTAEAAERHAG